MEVQISYSVPVLVTVDTEAREVMNVEILDESVELDGSYGGQTLSEEVQEAIWIAESATWPAWEF